MPKIEVVAFIMLFNSFDFLIYALIVFVLYWLLANRLKIQNLFVVIVSYVFYGWWDVKFLSLIALTTLCSYLSGILIEKYEDSRLKQKWINAINIIINISILLIFKYFNFFAENFANIFSYFGFEVGDITLKLILPVGISFYTFQALSYSIDVYRHKIKAVNDIIAFFAYISFFPQLVAGPIERATHLLPQFMKQRKFDYQVAVDGMRQILWGLFKKVVIADNCARAVDLIFGYYWNFDSYTLIIGAICFSIQIYGDFSGYSDIAIGVAKLFGIELMQNFKYPYFSKNIAEFWRRWHISLMTWFRDYVYIPLGGSRCAMPKIVRNTIIVFFLSGLWHGANWTFVVWGVYNAILFIPMIIKGKNNINIVNKVPLPIKELISIIITFIFVTIGWIIFRSENIELAWNYILRMFSEWEFPSELKAKTAILYIFILLSIEWIQRNKEHALQIQNISSRWLRYAIYYIIVLVVWYYNFEPMPFIYFQF